MWRIPFIALAWLALFLTEEPAHAQPVNPGVRQQGTVTANHLAVWAASNVIKDGGATADILNAICTTRGAVLYRNATAWVCLLPGTAGQVLTTNGAGADPSYTTVGGTGTVTSISAGTGIAVSPSPITTVGTVSLDSVADLTVLGNVSGGSAAPIALTATQLTTIPNAFTSALKGLAPASGGGTTNFLRADGSWAAPAGSSVSITSSTLTVSPSPLTGTGTIDLSAQNNLTVLGNVSGGSAAPIALTATQLTTIPNAFTSALKGLAPASGGGTTNYLRADGSWAAPPGATSGTVTSVACSGIVSCTTITSTGTVASATMADQTVWGNVTGGTSTPSALTKTQLTTLVNTFTSSLSGAAPSSGGGTTNFLRADGSWAAPTATCSSCFAGLAVQKFSASGTYTPNAKLLYAVVECYGGGGGGGGESAASAVAGGGGGGSGGRSLAVVTAATIGASKTVTIGALGAAGTSAPSAGSAGGNTSLNNGAGTNYCLANGGSGGGVATSSNGAGGAGGTAGTGDLTFIGQSGSSGLAGGTNPNSVGGRGGASIIGSGGDWSFGAVGNAASGFASGGSGASAGSGGSNRAGGDGTAGYLVVWEFLSP